MMLRKLALIMPESVIGKSYMLYRANRRKSPLKAMSILASGIAATAGLAVLAIIGSYLSVLGFYYMFW